MLNPTKLVFHGAVLLAQFLGFANLVAQPDARKEIEAGYAAMAEAWRAHDPDASVIWYATSLEVVSTEGKTEHLDRAQQLAATKFDMRKYPNTQYFPRQTTVVRSIQLNGDRATVQQTTIKELATIDRNGTFVHVRDDMVSEDEWVRTSSGWRMQRYHLLHVDRTSDARPSPAILQALENMRASNRALRSFNESNNMSNCMTANQNQRLDYETRKAYCSP